MRLPNDIQIVQAGRGAGKTYSLMNEINDALKTTNWSEVMVVFPEAQYAHWWIREWQIRFPAARVPNYVTANSTYRARGHSLRRVYIEDVDQFPDGIYDDSLQTVFFGIRFDNATVLANSNTILINARTCETEEPPRRKITWFDVQKFKDAYMIATMMAKIKEVNPYDQEEEGEGTTQTFKIEATNDAARWDA